MKLGRNKSKWRVLGDDGRIYSEHKSRKAAEASLELKQACIAACGQWDRMTPRQQQLVTEAEEKRKRKAEENKHGR